jgi:hypothetical protein
MARADHGPPQHRRTRGDLLELILLGRARTEPALGFQGRCEFGEVITSHDPGAGQRIFAQFHDGP